MTNVRGAWDMSKKTSEDMSVTQLVGVVKSVVSRY